MRAVGYCVAEEPNLDGTEQFYVLQVYPELIRTSEPAWGDKEAHGRWPWSSSSHLLGESQGVLPRLRTAVVLPLSAWPMCQGTTAPVPVTTWSMLQDSKDSLAFGN